jgi:hypothetical protein
LDGPDAGAQLETVLLGAVCGDTVRLWRGDGSPELRRLDRPAELAALVGRGELARTPTPDPERFREAALLDTHEDLLIALARPRSGDGAVATAPALAPLRAVRVDAAPSQAELWGEWAERFGAIALSCAQRGEYVVIETGGWEQVSEPYVLVAVLPGEDGMPVSVVEAFPAPDDAPWSGPADGAGGATLTAPATRDSVSVAGLLAAPAAMQWAASPLDLVLTFGRLPEASRFS